MSKYGSVFNVIFISMSPIFFGLRVSIRRLTAKANTISQRGKDKVPRVTVEALLTSISTVRISQLNGWHPTANTMKLEQQVCSLDLARRLKELGVKQESYFVWYNFDQLGWQIMAREVADEYRENYTEEDIATITSAFTVAELGSLLSDVLADDILRAYGYVMNVPDTTVITPRGLQYCISDPAIGAKMLCYLLENGLIPKV